MGVAHVPVVGFVGFGAVASCFAAALRDAGAEVLAYDVLLDRAGGADALAARAAGAPPRFVPLEALAARADIVLATVTTDAALAAARGCAPHLRPGQLYVDLNATSPASKREIAAVVAGAGADFVEGAILPAVGVMGARSKVLACGPRAVEVAATLTALGLNVHAYGEEIGRASSFKMLRSVFSKGFEAVLVECLLAAHRAGVGEDLWREIVATLDAASFEEVGATWVRTHATANARRYHEMVQVAQALQAMGLEAPMTAAAVRLFERSARLRLAEAFAAPPESAAAAIDALDARIAASDPHP